MNKATKANFTNIMHSEKTDFEMALLHKDLKDNTLLI